MRQLFFWVLLIKTHEYFELNEQDDSYATRLKDNLTGIQTNKLEDPHNWRFKI